MDSLRFVLAIVLMIAVVLITNLLVPHSRAPAGRVAPPTVSTAVTPRRPAAPPPPPAAAAPAAPTAPTAVTAAPEALTSAPVVVVRSPLYSYAISTAGGAITSAELLHYRSYTRAGPVQLASRALEPLIGYRLNVKGRVVDLRTLRFRAEPAGEVVLSAGSAPRTVRLVHDDSTLHAEIDYTFDPDHYIAAVHGVVRTPGADEMLVDLPSTLAVNEARAVEDYRALGYVVNSETSGISSRALEKVKAQRVEEGPLDWAAVKNKYFVVGALVGTGPGATPFGGLIAQPLPVPHAAQLTATLPVSRDGSWAYRLYMGPQETQRLAALGHDFQDVNPYGWRFLRPIIRPLAHVILWAVVGMHDLLSIGYGWVLILFGVLIRVLLWPLNARAMRAQLRNMEIQPRLKEVQERFKKDPERMQKEVMRLYKEEGFNPLGGCLPMLIPMPVLFTLYFVFEATIVFRGVSFFWLPDLSRPDPLYVLPVLLGVSMFALQWLGTRSMPQSNPQMKMMTYFLPIVWVFLFLNFASGLNLYYVAQNFASLPQQLQLVAERRRWQASRASPAR